MNEDWEFYISDEEPIQEEGKGKGKVGVDGEKKKKKDTMMSPTPSSKIPNQRTNSDRSRRKVEEKQKLQKQSSAAPSLRAFRQSLTPYLPPPVLKAIDRADPLLEPYMGEEGSVKLVGSMFLSYAIFFIIMFFSRRLLGHGKAIRDDEEEELLNSGAASAEYDQTVLFCGPTNSGKTRLFYQLVFNAPNIDTVTSLKANVAIFDRIRYMDWPGHVKLSSSLLQPVLASRPRIILVLDATQPVAAAADCLHLLFQTYNNKNQQQQQQQKNHSNKQPPIPILVLCHKSDLPSAKNEKRIQLQLRGELERLLKAQSASSSKSTTNDDTDKNASSTSSKESNTTSTTWWPVGEPIDLNALPFVTLIFRSTTIEKGKGCKQLVEEFCRTGTLSSLSPSTTLSSATSSPPPPESLVKENQ